MKWLLRFLLWATHLSAPFWMIGAAYHQLLAWATLSTLGIPARPGVLPPPDIPASHVLGVFAAMCLASTRAAWGRRLRALLIGVAALVVVEWLTGTLAVAWAMRDAGVAPASPLVVRLHENLTALPAWIGAPVLWLALLGDAELPGMRRRPGRASQGGFQSRGARD